MDTEGNNTQQQDNVYAKGCWKKIRTERRNCRWHCFSWGAGSSKRRFAYRLEQGDIGSHVRLGGESISGRRKSSRGPETAISLVGLGNEDGH